MFQLSLRSLLIFMALVALAIVSLRFSSVGWRTVVIGVALVSLWMALIVAVVDRGPRQAFAAGFMVSMAAYAISLFSIPTISQQRDHNPEFNPAIGRLPTTRLLSPLYEAIAETRWVDLRTGQEAIGYDPRTQGAAPGSQWITAAQLPQREVFMTIGHVWWAMLLGLCGGWFAQWVYLRRMREKGPLAAGRS
jgi:hypothetical protein